MEKVALLRSRSGLFQRPPLRHVDPVEVPDETPVSPNRTTKILS